MKTVILAVGLFLPISFYSVVPAQLTKMTVGYGSISAESFSGLDGQRIGNISRQWSRYTARLFSRRNDGDDGVAVEGDPDK